MPAKPAFPAVVRQRLGSGIEVVGSRRIRLEPGDVEGQGCRCWWARREEGRRFGGKAHVPEDRLARFRCARGEASEAAAAIEAVQILALAPTDQT